MIIFLFKQEFLLFWGAISFIFSLFWGNFCNFPFFWLRFILMPEITLILGLWLESFFSIIRALQVNCEHKLQLCSIFGYKMFNIWSQQHQKIQEHQNSVQQNCKNNKKTTTKKNTPWTELDSSSKNCNITFFCWALSSMHALSRCLINQPYVHWCLSVQILKRSETSP